MNEKILQAIKQARNTKRNFKQTFDLIINLKSLDLKKAENKIKTELTLPNGVGKESRIGVIVDNLIPQARDIENVFIIRKDELENYGKNKKAVKNIARECNYFIAEAALMPLVGKNLGQVLAPRNLMPRPIPPTANLKQIVNSSKNILRIALKESPVISCAVGNEDMEDEKISENIEHIINSVMSVLPKGKENIKNYIVKLSMGKGVKFVI